MHFIPEELQMNLKSMSLDRLITLKEKVEATLFAKVAGERLTLESKLKTLSHLNGGTSLKSVVGRGGAKGPVAPKYRNPENPAETWAGRGLKPRWLAAAIKSGKKQDDFLIAGATKAPSAQKIKKARKARK
jgi:DNA-binding protein H-NS